MPAIVEIMSTAVIFTSTSDLTTDLQLKVIQVNEPFKSYYGGYLERSIHRDNYSICLHKSRVIET